MPGRLDVFTIHAEIEGISMIDWFRQFLDQALGMGVMFVSAAQEASNFNIRPEMVPVAFLEQGKVDGRSGTLSVEGKLVTGI
jgi:undecaprenyl phosphate-alpha-L-ara4FN deformylase